MAWCELDICNVGIVPWDIDGKFIPDEKIL